MVALADDAQPPPAVAEDRRADADRLVAVDQVASLLDVQFDEGADPGQRLGVWPEKSRVEAALFGHLSKRVAVSIAQGTGQDHVDRAGEQAGSEAGDTEPRPLLLGKDGDGERAFGTDAGAPQQIQGDERGGDPERAVERSAAGHRVEVTSGDDGVFGATVWRAYRRVRSWSPRSAVRAQAFAQEWALSWVQAQPGRYRPGIGREAGGELADWRRERGAMPGERREQGDGVEAVDDAVLRGLIQERARNVSVRRGHRARQKWRQTIDFPVAARIGTPKPPITVVLQRIHNKPTDRETLSSQWE